MKKPSIISQIVGAIFFLVLLAGTIVFFITTFAAKDWQPPFALDRNYDRSAMQAALAPEAVGELFQKIIDCGPRAPGSEGLAKVSAIIENAYKDAGLEYYSQTVDIAYPLTEGGHGELRVGEKNIVAWPFWPNLVQPVATPRGGLSGTLFLVTEENVRKTADFSDKIAVLDLSEQPFAELGYNPANYAELGFKGIVVTHREGMAKIPWTQIANFDIGLPVNIPRVAAEAEVLEHIGEQAELEAHTKWCRTKNKNHVGVLRANPEKRTRSALFVPIVYDGQSPLCDLVRSEPEALATAIHLQLLKGLLPHREALNRDVIFVATSGEAVQHFGTCRLLMSLGFEGRTAEMKTRIDTDNAENEVALAEVEEALKLFDDPDFAITKKSAATDAAMAKLSPTARKRLTAQASYVMRERVFNYSEVLLNAEITFKRNPFDLESKEYHDFRTAKVKYDQLNTLSSLPLGRFLERDQSADANFEVGEKSVAIREALKARLEYLRDYHLAQRAFFADELKLQALFALYSDNVVFSALLQPSEKTPEIESIAYDSGYQITLGEAAENIGRMITDAIYTLGYGKEVTLKRPRSFWSNTLVLSGKRVPTMPFATLSHPGATMISGNSLKHHSSPTPTAAYTNLASIARSLQVFGEATISAARGYGRFPRLMFSPTYSLRGGVFASGVGNSVVPNYPVADALVFSSRDKKPPFFTDPYGQYWLPLMAMPDFWGFRFGALEVFLFDKDGVINYAKDNGATAQFIYNSRTPNLNGLPINLILYRGAPVAILNLVNPQSMKTFTSAGFINSTTLAAFASTSPYSASGAYQGLMDFIPPQEYFFVTLNAGAPNNELVATTRAFCLGTTMTNYPHFRPSGNEIDGAGYLASDTPILRNIAHEAASSMSYLSGKRLVLQKQFGMADEMTLSFEDKADSIIEKLEAPESASTPYLAKLREMRQALAYLIINHPVIRGSITEAVWGILWYMGLLVPFIFFFEKLVFGFSDIRKQICAQAVIFLLVFLLLRILHPAFLMIRSSIMILLGFVIILVVGSVTILLSAKFQENIDALRQAHGHVRGVSGNKSGIMMTAFMLGLNNMHRRKVRTGLTCATLVLMTFVMICFTSVQSNVVDKERAVGRAAYQGVLVRNQLFRSVSEGEIDALRSRYAANFNIARRAIDVGSISGGSAGISVPNYQVSYGEGDDMLSRVAKCGIFFDETEPLASEIKMITTNGWFTAEQAALTVAPYPIMLSDVMAEQLRITPELVNDPTTNVTVTISGGKYTVYGIFDSSTLGDVVDVDGQDLLPFDIESLSDPQFESQTVLAESNSLRVSPQDLIIGLIGQLSTEAGYRRTASVVVDMGNVEFKSAREEISAYMEQTGRTVYFGLDGTAYTGRRARVKTLAGLADLLIPLIIAALTVLNTMKGSVYERREEIFVYNAVGIAPRYVFFMFVAEALVYSVVGAVLGYILSQGTGRILTMLNLTGGLNMNFTSASTIYASLAIAAATIASTWFPARSAMEIAKPTDDAGWSLPPPSSDDTLEFDLPFTFTHYDRIAVLAFFSHYFINHGEGSAGPFFSADPQLRVADRLDPLAPEDSNLIPVLDVQVWLKPFDLGVSQKIVIELATDIDTKEYIAHMRLTRLTGTRDAWLRLNKSLIALIRQHFLHWRAIPEEMKPVMYAEAKAALEKYAEEA